MLQLHATLLVNNSWFHFLATAASMLFFLPLCATATYTLCSTPNMIRSKPRQETVIMASCMAMGISHFECHRALPPPTPALGNIELVLTGAPKVVRSGFKTRNCFSDMAWHSDLGRCIVSQTGLESTLLHPSVIDLLWLFEWSVEARCETGNWVSFLWEDYQISLKVSKVSAPQRGNPGPWRLSNWLMSNWAIIS